MSGGSNHAIVLVASPDSSLARELQDQSPAEVMSVAAVSSPYEAAACLLAEPVRVLVIDLRLIRGPHTQLLRIAHAKGVAMLGVGALPTGLSGDDLAGLTLTSRRELARFVQAALSSAGLTGMYVPANAEPTAKQSIPIAAPPPAPAAVTPAPPASAAVTPAPPAPAEGEGPVNSVAPAQPSTPIGPDDLEERSLQSLLEGKQEAPFIRGLEQEIQFELELQEPPPGAAGNNAGSAPPASPPEAVAPSPPRTQTIEQGLLTAEELDALLRGD